MMKKRKQSTKDNKPVTLKQLNQTINQALKPIEHRFMLHDARLEALEKAVHNLDETFKDNFTKMYSHIDAFMKRTESNETEILFLGRQHDNLAKYCTEKIGYPIYGRN